MDADSKKSPERPQALASPEESDIMKDLQKGGCAVCNHLDNILVDFFSKWQYLLCNNAEIQRIYAAEGGFCPVHTWQLSLYSSSRGLCRGYSELLRRIAAELSEIVSSMDCIPDRVESLFKGTQDCRVCRLVESAQARYVHLFAAGMEKQAIRAAYLQSPGACLQHLHSLVRAVQKDEVRRALISHAVESFNEIAEDMQRYTWKYESGQREQLTRNEKDAHLRALTKIAGKRYVYTPY